MELQLLEIQENKEIAKNFLTGKLAKLGALNTTGEAVSAIADLEAKYDRTYNTTKTSYELQLSTLSLKHQSALRELDRAKSDAINKLKDKELEVEADITKEFIDKLEKINEKVFSLKEKYIKEEQDISEKAVKFATDLTKDYFKRLEEILIAKTGATYLEGVLPYATKAKAEERALNLALKRKSLAKAVAGKLPPTISLSEAKTWKALWAYGMDKKEFLDKLTLPYPPKEWLEFKRYQTNVSYLPTSPISKEWEKERQRSLEITEKPKELEEEEIETLAQSYLRGESLGTIGATKKAQVMARAEKIKKEQFIEQLKNPDFLAAELEKAEAAGTSLAQSRKELEELGVPKDVIQAGVRRRIELIEQSKRKQTFLQKLFGIK